jgi:hypothetical protein
MQMQFLRDTDPVAGVVIAGAHARPAEELVTALRKVHGRHRQHVDAVCGAGLSAASQSRRTAW